MNRPNDVKVKAKLLSAPGILQLLADYTKLCDVWLLDADIEEGSDEEYAKITLKMVQKLREQYKGQMITCSKVVQMDIETAIENAYKDRKEKLQNVYEKLNGINQQNNE